MAEPSAPPPKPSIEFPWFLFITGLLAATGGHWLALASLHLLSHDEGPQRLIVPALLACLAMAWWLNLLRQRDRWPRGWYRALPRVVLAWAVFVAALWFAVSSEAYLRGWLDDLTWGDPLIVVVFMGFSLLALSLPAYDHLLKRIQGVHDLNLRQARRHDDAEAMILFLSTPNILPEICEDEGVHARVHFPEGTSA